MDLAEKALQDPSQAPVVLSFSEIHYDENHPGKASVEIFMSNRNPVAGFQVLRLLAATAMVPLKCFYQESRCVCVSDEQFRIVRGTDGNAIPVLSAKEGRAAEMKFQVSGGPSGIALGVSFAVSFHTTLEYA